MQIAAAINRPFNRIARALTCLLYYIGAFSSLLHCSPAVFLATGGHYMRSPGAYLKIKNNRKLISPSLEAHTRLPLDGRCVQLYDSRLDYMSRENCMRGRILMTLL
jgi:hypothetical protein